LVTEDDPTFPTYLLQDFPEEKTIEVKVKTEPIDTAAAEWRNIPIKTEGVSGDSDDSSSSDCEPHRAVNENSGTKREEPKGEGSSAELPNYYYKGEFHPRRPISKLKSCPECGALVKSLGKHFAQNHNSRAAWKRMKAEAKAGRLQKRKELMRMSNMVPVSCDFCNASVRRGNYKNHLRQHPAAQALKLK